MDLTPTERRVWEGFASGAQVACDGGEPVRASVIAGLMLGAQPVPPGFRKRVWLSGARITGPLDLSATVLDCEFIATGCAFDGPIGFGGAHARTIDLSASRFAALSLSDVTIEGRLDLTGVTCELVVLRGGRIAGDVRLDRAEVARLDLELAQVGGHLSAAGLHAREGAELSGCRTGGAVSLSEADIGVRLTAEQMRAGMGLDCRRLRAVGEVDFAGAVVGKDAVFRDAVMAGGSLDAADIRVGGEFDARHAAIAGGVNLGGAKVTGPVRLDGLRCEALSLRRAVLGDDLHATGVSVAAGLDLSGAAVAGGLTLSEAELRGETALDATGVVVSRGMLAEGIEVVGVADLSQAQLSELDIVASVELVYGEDLVVTGGARLDLTTAGQVSLGGSRVDGELVLSGAVGGLDLAGARITGSLQVFRFSARGPFDLTGSVVTGDVVFSDASFGTVGAFGAAFGQNVLFEGSFQTVPTTFAGDVLLAQATVQKSISFAGLVITGGLFCSRMTAAALVPPVHTQGLTVMMLDGAAITALADLASWPDTLVTDGLTYARIEVTPDERAARRWLRSNRTYAAQPYHHLAGYLRGLGEDSLARQVLLWQQRAARPQLSRTRRVFSFIMDMLAGYGYAPSRALLILLGSWVAGWAWFSRNDFRWHDGLVMLDLILPASPFGIEDLGQYHRADLVVASILVGMGWLLSLALLPAVTRSLSRT